MTITSVRKIIKVGPSLAVTIPADQAKRAGFEVGSEVDIVMKPHATPTATTIDAEYRAFKAQYGATLKNLAKR
jgi:antitoxin component of MazEF toxin-antitoxin module